jgi:phosphatidylglycerophosphate synthase
VRSTSILTIPNLLSLARFPLAAAFLASSSVRMRTWILGLAALTDLLDGWLARRGQSSQLGALLDPVADKTFVLIAVTAFLADGAISARDYLVVLSRDIMTVIGFFVATVTPGLKASMFKARLSGKVVTVLQLLALLLLLVRPAEFPSLIPLLAITSAWAVADYTLMLHHARLRS